ncbi:hypothetical protein GXP67_29770 [Rhodocytophaga rosea]|uniref:Nucleotide-diphospho-sugar transferase n=1 Tax=Rhodocytophaga rosea TaxID=2704465 RepID=A0A6C0GSW6_9BACT|nr:hypothetical protein [Rhodocytophaga rosea]QHT70542.1 hypothetical protein GXP67_29770 [Rhodocytophaga rosea]
MLNTPVLFLVFNRPDTTQRVFETIRHAKPKQLFIAADGPRTHKPEDAEKCSKVREIVSRIDWDCEVKTLFREKNLGCKYAVSSAIDWFFENVEEGIILEDDTLPDHSFFTFCETLLAYYRTEKKVMHIGGVNFQKKQPKNNTSYYFSKYNHSWGWATWRRAWQENDMMMKDFTISQQLINHRFNSAQERKYWNNIFTKTHSGEISTWDYVWTYTLWKLNGLSIIPNKNLVVNIGFGENATHTTNQIVNSTMQLDSMSEMIIHPNEIRINTQADRFTFQTLFYSSTSLINHIRNFCYKHLPDIQVNKLRTFRRRFFPFNN